MKRSFFPLVFSLMVFACSGQSSASFSLDPSFMLTASFHGSNEGGWIKKVTQLKVMVLDLKKAADADQWSKLPHDLKGEQFEDLFSFRKGPEKLQLLTKDGRDGLREVAFLAGGKDGGLYIRFVGKFTQKDLDEMQLSLKDKDEQ